MVTGLAALLAAGAFTGSAARASATAPAPASPAVFAPCSGCHSLQQGKTVFGPSLAGVSGRKAGSLPGYAYSKALKNSGITWNAATLDAWLTSPRKMVPGTRMPFMGIPDPAKRKAVVDFLLTLK